MGSFGGTEVGHAVGESVGEEVGAAVGAAVGGAQVEPDPHVPLTQSEPSLQVFPDAQWLQSGPPQSTSVSCAFLMLSVQEADVGRAVGDSVGTDVGTALGA